MALTQSKPSEPTLENKKDQKCAEAIAAWEAAGNVLPALEGTEKQIAWAESIRAEFLFLFDLRTKYLKVTPEVLARVKKELFAVTNAAFWITVRGDFGFFNAGQFKHYFDAQKLLYGFVMQRAEKIAAGEGDAEQEIPALTELTGTERQIEYAQKIRSDFFKAIEMPFFRWLPHGVLEKLAAISQAKIWIDYLKNPARSYEGFFEGVNNALRQSKEREAEKARYQKKVSGELPVESAADLGLTDDV